MNNRKETEVRLMVLLGIIRQLMASREAKLFADLSLNPSQFGVLNHFTHDPQRSWTVTELAEVMEMNQPGITKIVTVLLAKGLLLSQSDADDKRRRYLNISPQGLRMCSDIFDALGPDISYLFDGWENAELSKMQQQLDKLMRWLDEHRDDIKKC
ncbi:MarR family winged helix-turn-helix transcriptional regulator [Amphritea sp. HPY]|uniref:MarR family winged helix-turn-helix transcriptional regulator n=1 Tax=Amphritea sp. HPY TaxID=3421652 RepID=UPI003D7D7CD4